MKLKVNKDRVSHITLYGERRGVQEEYWKNKSYKLLPAAKKFWWWGIFFGWNKYKEAFYKDGEYMYDSILNSSYNYYTKEEAEKLDGVVIKGNELYTKPIIKIYIGQYLLKSVFFDTLADAETFCTKRFPNVNVTFK